MARPRGRSGEVLIVLQEVNPGTGKLCSTDLEDNPNSPQRLNGECVLLFRCSNENIIFFYTVIMRQGIDGFEPETPLPGHELDVQLGKDSLHHVQSFPNGCLLVLFR